MRSLHTSGAVYGALSSLIDRLDSHRASQTDIIPWSCPVPIFGNVSKSRLATVGINPSNREFVDRSGHELQGDSRRFHTLTSLGIESWADADIRHIERIWETYCLYFSSNPYNSWFNTLEYVIAGANVSYYDSNMSACHLDLIPYATSEKWSFLTQTQRRLLISMTGDTLGTILRESSILTLILNGSSVVSAFEIATGCDLEATEIPEWSLARRSGRAVRGVAYTGTIDRIFGSNLDRKIDIFGFNHNLQSSFGVTTNVLSEIRNWIAQIARPNSC